MAAKIKLVALDDGYDAKRSEDNARKLIADANTVALISCMGTANNQRILPLVDEAQIPYITTKRCHIAAQARAPLRLPRARQLLGRSATPYQNSCPWASPTWPSCTRTRPLATSF